jgi:3-phenylpropionate/trans-cinnamate dioxygenase ferredoxin reductase subunit
MNPHVLVVGAGLAGLRAAEQLRAAGHAGSIEVIGGEPHLPYNRPPLTKQALVAGPDVMTLMFPRRPSIENVRWTLGRRAVSVDLDGSTLSLDDGSTRDFDGLVIATGVRSRRLPIGEAGGPAPTLTLRTVDDALALHARLAPGARVVVIGAGFIGCEVAATVAARGGSVHVLDPLPAPLAGVLGPAVGSAVRARLEAAGVAFSLGLGVAQVLATPTGGYAVHLTDSADVITADVVVEAVGSVPETEWLAGQGLDLGNGIGCDGDLLVTRGGIPLRNVVALGDVARFPHPWFGREIRVEHWAWPTDLARRAAASLVAGLGPTPAPDTPFTPLPSFWSDLPGGRIQSFGLPPLGLGDVRLLEGEWEGDCAVGYHRDGRLVGLALVGLASRMIDYRTALLDDLSTGTGAGADAGPTG